MPAKRSLTLALALLLIAAIPAQATSTPTVQVIDINPMAASSSPNGLIAFGNKVFFSANDGTHGQELWRTDGAAGETTVGSELACDIHPSGGSNPNLIGALGDWLYFTADDGTNGNELYRTNGAVNGCEIVGINADGDANVSQAVVIGDKLWFSADNGIHGFEVWYTDNSVPVRVTDINSGAGDANPADFTFAPAGTEVGETYIPWVYFTADDGVTGIELYRTDGVDTFLFADLNMAAGTGSNPDNLYLYNGALWFSANDGESGRELWVTGGGPTELVDLNPGVGSSDPANFIAYGGLLYFTAANDATGSEPRRTNGIEISSYVDLFPGPDGSGVFSPIVIGDWLYFTANNGGTGYEPWRTDGVEVQQVADLITGPSGSFPYGYTPIGGQFVFQATLGSAYYPWISDGTEAGTTQAAILSGTNAYFGCECDRPFAVLEGRVFSYQGNDEYGYEPAFFELPLPETNGDGSPLSTALVLLAAATAAAGLTIRRGSLAR